MKIDAVFEGGGVKGIGFVGAIQAFEQQGFRWNRVAGTSAGAIIAGLLAAGFTAEELRQLMKEFNYVALQKKQGIARIPFIGPWVNLWVCKGMYTGDYLYKWVEKQLRRKNVCTFGDLPAGSLKIIASDITDGRLLVIPDDLDKIGYDPSTFSVALAIRMSASLPFYLQPVILKNGNAPVYIVDGGILSKFPLWIFGENTELDYPTIGFRLSAGYEAEPYPISNFPDYVHAMLRTMMQAHDQRYVEKQHAARTVFIPTDGISTTKFDLTEEERDWLYESGNEAAHDFFTRLPALRKKRKTS
ncbi:patatin-like phospholipase family protein [Aneurinibacillus tyrosinisolvens]|jgi:NTE family protein|uniref:patatin-like phospholipase family protein n=1 Tax=Aneurinibacillus tyrosinisolvens TaxID=1443435 RepID=UPI00063EF033|nr:patatin-like phospholipase family protein [Aneurinibacillus tyrosinisolvens]